MFRRARRVTGLPLAKKWSLTLDVMRVTYEGEFTRRKIKRKKDGNNRQTRWLLHSFSYFSMDFSLELLWNWFPEKDEIISKPVVFVSHLSSCLFPLWKIGKEMGRYNYLMQISTRRWFYEKRRGKYVLLRALTSRFKRANTQIREYYVDSWKAHLKRLVYLSRCQLPQWLHELKFFLLFSQKL